ncbi:L-serine dehydratase 1 [Baekduia alba]|uniref:L-serine ammonia-lyase n=1 Tax=Baekduia alba TaxID=2997333 RepID=UPI00233FB97F|nr:L-serine ammonia-lyase [Baekduia alba]WCB94928.1 L-serine dehydratase 1 [Baekduia alba]
MTRPAAPASSISVFDLFKVGIGPSSSHTVGPMRAAGMFCEALNDTGALAATERVVVELYGSLAATGAGHGTPVAVLLGLAGERPELVDPDAVPAMLAGIRERGRLALPGGREIAFDEDWDLVAHRKDRLPGHVNGMRFTARDAAGDLLHRAVYYSVGGGFVVAEGEEGLRDDDRVLPRPFATSAELLAQARANRGSISGLVMENEMARCPEDAVRERLLFIWEVMQRCVRRGCGTDGVLPGGLGVRRRAPGLRRSLEQHGDATDPLRAMEWVTLFALAVNEENAAGGRVVTAPTNGAAGIVPAVLHYYARFVPGADDDGVVRFLLTAAAIGSLCKRNASISGAEVGCQGEVGSASAMAAAGLAEVLGGTPEQVENAAEIAMEHSLGLTCDPVGGLVQIPCIERNAIASVKAIASARLALRGDGAHRVSLDEVIKTMRDTGADMSDKYKETARGGLAVNVVEC